MNIVICGGGTAGWMAALMIKRAQPIHNITVVESSAIPIIGAGEGSTGLMTGFIQELVAAGLCTEREFMAAAAATPKLGILHKDWKHVGHSYYGPIDSPTPVFYQPEHAVGWAELHNIPAHLVSGNGRLLEAGVTNFKSDGRTNDGMHGYHFDAHKVGAFFKQLAMRLGVAHKDAKVLHVNQSALGIKSLQLDTGVLAGDFFIDASGFARVLTTALGGTWRSYREYLPVNTALPFLLPHTEVPEAVTVARAQKSGWMWQIPTADRMGCGYVFCDEYITPDAAQQEIEATIGTAIDPIRVLKFDTGRQETVWNKNCLTIGLAAAFAEPLEATSIHSTLVQLRLFVNSFLRPRVEDTVLAFNIKHYNKYTAQMYDDFRDFLVLHYMGNRTDSLFWTDRRQAKVPPKVEAILDVCQHRLVSQADFTAYFGYAGASLWNWVLAGLGKFTLEIVKQEADISGFRGMDFSAQEYLSHFSVDKNTFASMRDFVSLQPHAIT